jgi:integrase
LIQIRLDDLDLDGGLVRVESGKGGRGRIVPAGRRAVEWLRKWLDVRVRLVRDDTHGRVFVSKSGPPPTGRPPAGSQETHGTPDLTSRTPFPEPREGRTTAAWA